MRYQFGEFILDLHTGELLHGEVATPLRRQTLRLLQVLLESAPALLTHDQLLDEVWGRSALSPNALPQAISELRRALGDDAESPRYIDTRRGLGYRFIEPVKVLDDPLPPPAAVPLATAALKAERSSRLGGVWWGIAGALVLLLGFGALSALRPLDPPRSGLEQPLPKLGLAIAPFAADPAVADWVPHAAFELFAQVLQSERLTLFRSDTLGVSPDDGGLRWQHQAHDLLGASHALSGRWQRTSGGELQLDLSVLSLASGEILDSRQFTAPIGELDQLVGQAGELIARALRLAVGRAENPEMAALTAADRSDYWSALSALARADAGRAASSLAALHEKLGKPGWIEADLARALILAQQGDAAQALLGSRLQQGRRLPLGERLRLQAQLARLRHQPLQAAAAQRALVELYPDTIEFWLDLIEAELDALQGSSARTTMTQLAGMPQAQADPRLSLLRARLSLLDNDYPQAQAEAAVAMRRAVAYDLPGIAISAGLVHSDSLSQQGEVAAAAEYLLGVEQEWSDRASAEDRFGLRMRRIKLLRTSGDFGVLGELVEQASEQAASAVQRVQWGIERALIQSAQGQHDQAQQALDALTPQLAETAQLGLRISWHDASAVVALARNQVDLARQEFDAAFALARGTGQERFSAPLQVNAGMLLARQRRFAEADAMWSSALQVFTQLGDRRGQATCLGNLAASAAIQGRPEQSRELNTQALALFRELGVVDAQARTAYNLGLDAARFGRRAEAVELFAEARTAWLAGAQLDLAIRAAVGEAELILLAAQPKAALAALDTLPNSEASSALSRAALLATRANILLAQGELAQAKALQELALQLRKQAGSEAWAALSELDLLRTSWLQGADATQVHVGAEAMARRFAQLKETRDTARAWLLVAEAQLSLGQQPQALRAIERVQKGLDEFADRPLELELLRVSAWAAPPQERSLRLHELRRRALDEGYLWTVAMIDASLGVAFVSADLDDSLRLAAPPYAQRN